MKKNHLIDVAAAFLIAAAPVFLLIGTLHNVEGDQFDWVLAVIAGGFMLIAGVVLLVGARVVDELRALRSASEPPSWNPPAGG